ncbi:hypothetical protein LY76DRAFT_117788 [Colletotrichum caudatum]|nr:hypothetical protein LY76DRAFT_117788 [Colletotrichum caudatum]
MLVTIHDCSPKADAYKGVESRCVKNMPATTTRNGFDTSLPVRSQVAQLFRYFLWFCAKLHLSRARCSHVLPLRELTFGATCSLAMGCPVNFGRSISAPGRNKTTYHGKVGASAASSRRRGFDMGPVAQFKLLGSSSRLARDGFRAKKIPRTRPQQGSGYFPSAMERRGGIQYEEPVGS